MNNKRVLIVSANPVSAIYNNGKTLASIFDTYPREKIAQLYFSTEIPDNDICSTYYRISDIDMLNYKLGKVRSCGGRVQAQTKSLIKTDEQNAVHSIKKNSLTRLMREVLWCGKCITKDLTQWLDGFKPEVIFFLAGDAVFTHRICASIASRYGSKVAMYITDDYILPRMDLDIFGHFRRFIIRKYMKKSIASAGILFTISDAMRECYRKKFGKDSFVIANMYEPSKLIDYEWPEENAVITYAGGMHYNRHETIKCVVKAINAINIRKKCNVSLRVYSGSELSEEDVKELQVGDCCVLGGLLNKEALEKELLESHYLLHVESFKKCNICDTKLSLSTKIPEYMSYCKPIIAIGPSEVASLQYLEDCACCITQLEAIEKQLENVLFDKERSTKLSKLAYDKYLLNHNKMKLQPKIITLIHEI